MSDKQPGNRRGPSAEEVNFLFYLIGQAVWYIQHLEGALSGSIALKVELKDASPGSVPKDVAKEILLKLRRMTLGQAVKHAKKHAIYNDRLQLSLEDFLDERNWLIHSLLHESGGDMNINGKRENLFRRLHQITANAQNLQKEIATDLEIFVLPKGVTREEIYARAQHEFLKNRGLI